MKVHVQQNKTLFLEAAIHQDFDLLSQVLDLLPHSLLFQNFEISQNADVLSQSLIIFLKFTFLHLLFLTWLILLVKALCTRIKKETLFVSPDVKIVK